MPCLFPSDAHTYSELSASVRSERGLPREPGLVLCSPECPSGGKVASLTWPILSCLSLQFAHGPARMSSIHSFIHAYIYICYTHTHLTLGTVLGLYRWVRHNPLPQGAHSPVKEKSKYMRVGDVMCLVLWHWNEGCTKNRKKDVQRRPAASGKEGFPME